MERRIRETKMEDIMGGRYRWVVPPRGQGQTAEVAYSNKADEDGLYYYKRVTDKAEQTVTYYRTEVENVEGEYDPANTEPKVAKSDWKLVKGVTEAVDSVDFIRRTVLSEGKTEVEKPKFKARGAAMPAWVIERGNGFVDKGDLVYDTDEGIFYVVVGTKRPQGNRMLVDVKATDLSASDLNDEQWDAYIAPVNISPLDDDELEELG